MRAIREMWEEFRYFCFLRCNGGVDPRSALQTRFDELCKREKDLEEERDALRLKVKALEEALREIEWSNNSEWQSDRAKEALEDICPK